ncbi:MAG: hypothetical protein AAGA96_00845 [Verrucomicrobiota bacterium]
MSPDVGMMGVLMIAVLLVMVGVLGFFIGRVSRPSGARVPRDSLEIQPETDSDDPTAPITPVVEMAKSPHDRHRDMEVGNRIVKSIDLLDLLIRSGGKLRKEELVGQLSLLREEVSGLLGGCSYEAFTYEPGTAVDREIRSRIVIVEGNVEGERAIIQKTLLCGYLYRPEEEEEIVIRKAEVRIG